MILLLLSLAEASTLYAVRYSDDQLVRFNTTTLRFDDVGFVGTNFEFGSLAWDPTTDTMYMADGAETNMLWTVDLDTGMAAPICELPHKTMYYIQVDPFTGQMYAIRHIGFQTVYAVDKATCVSTLIGDLNAGVSGGFHIRQDTGEWHIREGSFVQIVDPVTLQLTNIGNTLGGGGSLAYDVDNGSWWLSSEGSGGVLANVEMATNTYHYIEYNVTEKYGLAYVDEHPKLSVTGSCPGVLNFQVSGFPAFANVRLARSAAVAPSTAPSFVCNGVEIGLDTSSLHVVGPLLTTDANGEYSGSFSVSASCGFHLQALSRNNCQTTNLWYDL